jgi:hypothetical protein
MMRQTRLTGPGAGVEKYDLLTALSVAGLHGSGLLQTSVLRLIALVTARYNWVNDELSMGHREMATLWSVDERTAKRETKRLIDAGLLALKRRGARGRVSCYRLCKERIFALSEPIWQNVGPDFQDRMSERQGQPAHAPKVVKVDFAARRSGSDPQWDSVLAHLSEIQPARAAAWYARLNPLSYEGGHLVLEAGSSFAQQYIQTHLMAELEAAARAAYPGLERCILLEKRH